jgi:hypothetical protein
MSVNTGHVQHGSRGMHKGGLMRIVPAQLHQSKPQGSRPSRAAVFRACAEQQLTADSNHIAWLQSQQLHQGNTTTSQTVHWGLKAMQVHSSMQSVRRILSPKPWSVTKEFLEHPHTSHCRIN